MLSAGVHGGLVLYDWGSPTAKTSAGDAPVVVALVPQAIVQPEESFSQPKVTPKSKPDLTRPKQVVKQPPVEPAKQVKPVVKPPQLKPPVPLPERKVAKVAEALRKDSVEADLVCVDTEKGETEKPVVESAVVMQDTVREQAESMETVAQTPFDSLVPASLVSDGLEERLAGGRVVEAVPNYRRNPLPEYPYIARQKRWEGVVWLLVDVSSGGRVEGLKVEGSCGHRVLDRAASKTVKRWEFTPATRAGLPVASQVRIPVRFRLEDG
jgi:protein TonB